MDNPAKHYRPRTIRGYLDRIERFISVLPRRSVFAVNTAVGNAALTKRAGFRTLSHSFASHLIEHGQYIRTTMIFTRVLDRGIEIHVQPLTV